MISKAKIKWIKSLEQRKNRLEGKVFVAEGPKLVGEMLAGSQPVYLCALHGWLNENRHRLNDSVVVDEVTQDELSRVSFLKTPQSVLAVFPIYEHSINPSIADNALCLALDGVQDPGNIGTILRIADWFGIHDIICSRDTVDIYNPKAVQATMGALARVRVHYVDLAEFLSKCKTPIYGTFLDGKSMYQQELSNNGVIVMGNEGKGVSPKTEALVSHKLFIPNYPIGTPTVESLNVAIATSIVCAEFRRRQQ